MVFKVVLVSFFSIDFFRSKTQKLDNKPFFSR
jgi:hypothetical protein